MILSWPHGSGTIPATIMQRDARPPERGDVLERLERHVEQPSEVSLRREARARRPLEALAR